MKVKLTCSIAGPAGMFPAGSVLDTTEKEAASFIAAGYAVPYDDEEETEIETTQSKDFLKRETTAKRINRLKK